MINKKVISLLPFVFIVIFALLASYSLFGYGFFPMHDNEQVGRLFELDYSIKSGNIPPRISQNLGFGYGYPFFNFYPSFAYYVGEVFHLVGFGYILSTKLMLFTGFLLSALFAYLLSKEFFGKVGGVISAAAYTFIPYHAVDIYVRGAFAEFFAFVFLPAIFWSMYKLTQKNSSFYIILTSLFIAGLILSHNLIALMSAPFIFVWLLYLGYIRKKDRKSFLVYIFLAVILGVGLSAYFFLPSYLERNFTLINILTSELADYKLHFVCIKQLWDAPWGYGGSIANCEDGLSFEAGKIQLVLSVLVFLTSLLAFVKRRDKMFLPILVFFSFLLGALFLTIRQSSFVWALLPPLWYVQFPWRYLLIIALVSSFLSGGVVYFVKNNNTKIAIAVLVVALLIGFNFSYFKPEKIINVSDNDYVSLPVIRWDTSSLAYEYVPRGIATRKTEQNTTAVDITKEEIAKSSFTTLTEGLVVDVDKDLPHLKEFNVVSKTGGNLRINTYSFPGWEVYVDGKKVKYTDNNKLKLIDVRIPEGEHVVIAKFTNTPVRTIGNLISFISIIGLCVIAFMSRRIYGKN